MMFVRKSIVVFLVLLTISLAGHTAWAVSPYDSYGVMWSNQLKDGEAPGTEGTNNRYNAHGGAMGTSGYVNNAWIHSNSPTVPMWGKFSTAGGWQGAVTQFDKWGGNIWTDFHSPVNQQSYLRASAVRGDKVVMGGWNRQNIETNAVEDNYYLRMYNGNGNLTNPDIGWSQSFTTASAWARAAYFAPNGDLYTVGYTQANIEGLTYGGGGDRDMNLMKHDANGEVVSGIIPALSTGTEIPGMIATDASGNIYVAGGTDGSISGFTNAGGYDTYVVKYDSSYNQQWVKQFGGPENEFVYSGGFDSNGNLLIVGDMSVNIDGTTNSGVQDAYIRSINPADGSVVWNDQFGSAGADLASGLGFDSDGNTWIGGQTAGVLEGTSAGGIDVFFRKYDSSGNVLETHQVGTTGEDYGRGAAVDVIKGRLYIGGWIQNGGWRGWAPSASGYNGSETMTLKVTAGDSYNSDTTSAGQDGYVNWDDMTHTINNLGSGGGLYDFDGDSDEDVDDIAFFMEQIFESEFGDFNFDGVVEYGPGPGTDESLLMGWQPGDAPIALPAEWTGFSGPTTPTQIDFEEWNYLFNIPEPSTFLLSVIGLLGLLGWRRRGRQ